MNMIKTLPLKLIIETDYNYELIIHYGRVYNTNSLYLLIIITHKTVGVLDIKKQLIDILVNCCIIIYFIICK